jgi:hypothetical protein
MIQLGSLTLTDGLVWEDEYAYTGIVQDVKTTLGGVPVVYSAVVQGPRPITLRSAEDQGWQTLEQVTALMDMAKTKDGVFTLQLDARSFTVRFRHNDPPVVEARPLVPRTTAQSGDYFVVSIKLAVDNAI